MRTLARRLALTLLLVPAACSALSSGEPSILTPERRHPPRTQVFDVEHYALDLSVDPAAETLFGTCTVRLWPLDAALDRVALDLVGLAVARVVDGAGRVLAYEHVDGSLEIELARTLMPGDFVELESTYGGQPLRGLWFAGRAAGEASHVFTQGECEDSRYWFPCWDAPADRATSEVRVSMPADWVSVAAGERVDHGELDDGRVFEHWRMNAPHPAYLVTLVAGEFEVIEDVWDGVPLTYLAEPELAPFVEPTYACTGDVLSFFSEVTGKRYPYSKYGQANVANFPFGGMENISATTMTATILRDERGRRDYDATGLIAHEAAHQWFGDLLTNRHWSHIWLNESFATYFTQLYFEHARGTDEFRARVLNMQESYLKGDVGEDRRPIVWDLYRDPMDLFGGGHAYPGGASRLHLLRFVLGDEAFFAGIRGYVLANENRAVVTDDFERAMEAASGRDLGWFFDLWLHSPGFPEFDWSWTWDADAGAVVFEVRQVQDPSDGTPEVFRTPVELYARGDSWEEVVRVEIEAREGRFELPCLERPTWVQFDRHGWIPKLARVERSLDEWLAIAALDTDVNARREAVRSLGRELGGVRTADEARSITLGLIERLVDDDLSWVRVDAARSLAQSEHASARSSLRQAALADEAADVRVAALEALMGSGANEEDAEFAREQYAAGYSWAVMGAAAQLVASADPEGAHDWLVERLATSSPHDNLRASILVAVAKAGDARAREVFEQWAFDEQASSAARVSAVTQLGLLGPGAAGSRPELEDLLVTTRDYRLQGAVIEALGKFEDVRSVPCLEAFHRRCEDSRQRRKIEELLRRPWAMQA